MSFPSVRNSEQIYIKKVLIEKYGTKWMLNWIKIQKQKSIKIQDYDEAARWRDVELKWNRLQENNNKHLQIEFDCIFFYLFEFF